MRAVKFLKIIGIFLLVILAILAIVTTVVYISYRKIPNLNSPISLLVLGKGGEGHTAPNLTDTIMQVNLNPALKKVSILSLPRDIWIEAIRAKLNTAYHYGGFKMASDSVSSVTGLQTSYTVVVDFSLFKDLIDTIGGISVNVENSFVDEKYPIAGLENDLCNGDRTYACRYEKLTFNKGSQSMNGDLALKFVRSRNAVGDEGTDLARELRQQKVIQAIKEKLLSREVLLKPEIVKRLYETAISHVETDIDRDTSLALAKLLFESRDNINFLSIPEEMLTISQNDRKYDRQYVFLPKSGSWKELQEWISQKI